MVIHFPFHEDSQSDIISHWFQSTNFFYHIKRRKGRSLDICQWDSGSNSTHAYVHPDQNLCTLSVGGIIICPCLWRASLGWWRTTKDWCSSPAHLGPCFRTHACPCCDAIWQLSHVLATRMYHFKPFSRKEGKPQMMNSDLQRKMENIIFKCLICFINCEGVCAFQKEILQIPVVQTMGSSS